jgi:uncharacterized protein YutE (UPF0331/DUF86 family)
LEGVDNNLLATTQHAVVGFTDFALGRRKQQKTMDVSIDITFEYVTRIRHHDDILGIVLKGHLLVEHLVDLLIQKCCKEAKAILSDHRAYPFAVKARLLHEMNVISRHLYANVLRINRIRNELAHSLTLDTSKIDYKFDRDDQQVQGTMELRSVTRSHKNPTKRYLWLLCFGTLSQLQAQYYKRFGSFPLFDAPISREKQGRARPNNALKGERRKRRAP